jgi:hypothetical protein
MINQQISSFLFNSGIINIVMKITDIIKETTSGAIATVATPLFKKPIKRVREFGADNAQTTTSDPAQAAQQAQKLKQNLNQLKGAGVEIDPNKDAEDPANAAGIAGAVEKALADPTLAPQIKNTLQKAQQKTGQ